MVTSLDATGLYALIVGQHSN